MQRKTLILGVGNILMGDEGAGVHVVRYLEEHYNLPGTDMVDGGTGGFNLLEYFQQYKNVILVDATIDGKKPGTITKLTPKFSGDYPPALAAHDIGLKDLLDALYLLQQQPEITLFTISIHKPDTMNTEPGPEIKKAVPDICKRIVDHLGYQKKT